MKKSVSLAPEHLICLDKWLTRSQYWISAGKHKRAILALKKALEISPHDVKIINNLALLLTQTSQPLDALVLINKAIEINPDYSRAYCTKAIALLRLARFDEALSAIECPTKLNCDSSETISLKAHILVRLKRFNEAAELFIKSIELDSENEGNYLDLAATFYELARLGQAIIAFQQALRINPNNFKTYVNLSVCYLDIGQFDPAMQAINQALTLEPDSIDAQWNKSIIYLLQGNYQSGLELFASRKRKKDTRHHYRKLNKPLLRDIAQLRPGKTLYIYPEQGLGDFIQMLRYVRPLERIGCHIFLETPPELISVTQKLISGNTKIVNALPDENEYDFQCPIMDLMCVFLSQNLYQANETPYIFSCLEKSNDWMQRLGPKTKLRIGVVWSSVTNFKYDAQRSLLFSEFKTCLPDDLFEVICLQKVLKDQDKDAFESYGLVSFFGNELNDFSDTAALIECVDIVITTCTSVAHLSAAMNKPTWILLKHVPDWRWQISDTKTPWYPSVRLFRQDKPYNWTNILSKVKSDLLVSDVRGIAKLSDHNVSNRVSMTSSPFNW